MSGTASLQKDRNFIAVIGDEVQWRLETWEKDQMFIYQQYARILLQVSY